MRIKRRVARIILSPIDRSVLNPLAVAFAVGRTLQRRRRAEFKLGQKQCCQRQQCKNWHRHDEDHVRTRCYRALYERAQRWFQFLDVFGRGQQFSGIDRGVKLA